MVADRISRAAVLGLVRVGPALVQRAVPREAGLACTLLGALAIRDWVNAYTYILVAAFYN